MLISVCMCTYKRKHLKLTLESVGALRLEENIDLEIVVVDNDEAQSGRDICSILAASLQHPIKYEAEPRKNISAARNKCLDIAQGDWIAFIDDDEVADKDWLSNLLDCARQYESQAVFGRVNTIYPKDCPDWILKGRFFDRKIKISGSTVTSGACNSTLLDNRLRKHLGIKFDESYGLTGGEDADFFHRFHLNGAKMVNCHEAFVEEEIEPNRLNANYLIKRALRIGQTFTKYRFCQSKTTDAKFKFIFNNTVQALGFSFLTLLYLPLGKRRYFNMYLKLVDKYGKLSFFLFSKSETMYD